ncbi:MAG TPA: hypothetical protein VM869_09815, partial [Enhygromyxa sp.]|nr:hypothetical protein [Enhygromyxa sp.]
MILALRRPYQDGPSLHFPAGDAPAEVMWYSHPTYAEREANAKRSYIAGPRGVRSMPWGKGSPSESDGGTDGASPAGRENGPTERSHGSAWALVDDPSALRRRATVVAYEKLGYASALEREALRSAAEVEQRIAEELAERTQGQQYFGFYDNRILELGDIDRRIAEATDADEPSLAAAAEPWRGASLEQFMQRWTATDAKLERQPTSALEQERERQRSEAREGDRALFRWLWRQADPDARAELERRARFLVFVQQHIVTLNRHRNTVAPMFAAATDPDELHEPLAALHRDLARMLVEAERVSLPDLQNLAAGGSTRTYLLSDPLVDMHDGEQPLREWLGAFMPQVGGVHERLRTLHYKNLGRLLALREQIEGRNQIG